MIAIPVLVVMSIVFLAVFFPLRAYFRSPSFQRKYGQ